MEVHAILFLKTLQSLPSHRGKSWSMVKAQISRLCSVCSVSPGSVLCLSCPNLLAHPQTYWACFSVKGYFLYLLPLLPEISVDQSVTSSRSLLIYPFPGRPFVTSLLKRTPCTPTVPCTSYLSSCSIFPLELLLFVYFIYLSCLLSIFIKM